MSQIGCFSRPSSMSDGSLAQPMQARLSATFEGAPPSSTAGGAAVAALAASLSAFSAASATRTSLVAAPRSGCCSRSLASSCLKPRPGSATRRPRTASRRASDISATLCTAPSPWMQARLSAACEGAPPSSRQWAGRQRPPCRTASPSLRRPPTVALYYTDHPLHIWNMCTPLMVKPRDQGETVHPGWHAGVCRRLQALLASWPPGRLRKCTLDVLALRCTCPRGSAAAPSGHRGRATSSLRATPRSRRPPW
eukprot:scaffold74140_cov66-Phaeocystis_antarctica.AAC.1